MPTPETPLPTSPSLRAEADRLIASGALGRSPVMRRLFDYLVARSEAGSPPKELEIGAEVFDRGSSFDASADATVRVYAHKLRQRLEMAARDAGAAPRLALLRGEYRIVVVEPGAPTESPEPPLEADESPPEAAPHASRRALLAGVAGAAAVGLVAGWALGAHRNAAPASERALTQGPLWRPLLSDERPLLLVLGDDYLLGESRDGRTVSRLVREYAINSRTDLDSYLMEHPGQMGRLVDLDLRYLPAGTAQVLARASALLADTRRTAPRVVLMSDFTPAMLNTSDVVYMGYFSGMSWFRGYAFAGSRFRVGESFDEVRDLKTSDTYVGEGGAGDAGDRPYHDYGYVSAFTTPAGGHVVILAGTRDAGLIHAGQAATSASSLDEALRAAKTASNFEALYFVTALHGTSVGGRLIAAGPLNHPNGEPRAAGGAGARPAPAPPPAAVR